MSRWIALTLAVFACLIALRSNSNDALAVTAMSLTALSMIFRPGWWTFWMPLGFWAQRASDVSQADKMGPVVAFIGWILLVVTLIISVRI